MKFEVFLTIEERDKKGRWVSRRKTRSNSVVQNFLNLLCGMAGQQTLTMTDTAGAAQSVSVLAQQFQMNAGVGTITNGIRVGTGTNAVSVTDTALQTYILHGTSAGNLSHGANSVSTPVTVGTSRQYTVSRSFTNNTASTITVNEVGLGCVGAVGSWTFLIDRTLNTFSIGAGATKTVTYTIKITV